MSAAVGRLRGFVKIFDARFEDLKRDSWKKVAYRDLSAGLIVALTAIPLAMGFAIAMCLRPEQGIIAGALACVIGRTFGGSKYQVYGPTAAFIPVIASLMHKYGEANGGSFAEAHGYLVLVSMIAGVVLILAGIGGLGRFAKHVPSSIVVGFTVGIAATIALSNFGESLGIAAPPGSLRTKVVAIVGSLGSANLWALSLAVLTFVLAKGDQLHAERLRGRKGDRARPQHRRLQGHG
jgi:SulP family sulfate permease